MTVSLYDVFATMSVVQKHVFGTTVSTKQILKQIHSLSIVSKLPAPQSTRREVQHL